MATPRRRVSPALTRFLLFCAALPAAARAQSSDWSFTLRAATSAGPRGAIARHFQVSGTRIRIDTDQDLLPPLKGSYELYDTRDSTLTTVMPSQRQASIVRRPGSAALAAIGFTETVRDYATPVLQDLGPGDTIGGHATRHYRAQRTYNVAYTLGARSCTRPRTVDSEYWMVPDMDVWPVARATVARVQALGGAVFDTLLLMVPRDATGTPIRTASTFTDAYPGGGRVTTTITIEILDASHAPIDPSRFEVPAGFERITMPTAPAGAANNGPSAATLNVWSMLCGEG